MSRSALHRQMQRELRQNQGVLVSNDPYAILEELQPQEEALGEDGLPFHGNAKTLNMEGVLATNIVSNKVFRFEVAPIETVEDVARDIPEYTSHVEPWEAGVTPRTASAAFMYTYKLGTMRLTRQQLRKLLRWDNLFVRAVALLWVRYTLPPPLQWRWFEPHLSDHTPFQAEAPPTGVAATGSAAQGKKTTFGTWARGLLADFHYFSTLLPRTPVLLARDWEAALPAYEQDERRAAANAKRMEELVPDTAIRARRYEEQGQADKSAESSAAAEAGAGAGEDDGASADNSSIGKGGDGKKEGGPVAAPVAQWVEATVMRTGEGKGRAGVKVPLVWVAYKGDGADTAATPLELRDIELPRAAGGRENDSSRQDGARHDHRDRDRGVDGRAGRPYEGHGRDRDMGRDTRRDDRDFGDRGGDRGGYNRRYDGGGNGRDDRDRGGRWQDERQGGYGGGAGRWTGRDDRDRNDRDRRPDYGRDDRQYGRDGPRGYGRGEDGQRRDRSRSRSRGRDDRYSDRGRYDDRDRDRDRYRDDRRGGRDYSPRRDRSRSRSRDRGRPARSSRSPSPAHGPGADDYDALLRNATQARAQPQGQAQAASAAGSTSSAAIPASLAARYGSGQDKVATGRVGGQGYRHERDVEGQEDVVRW